MSELSERLRRLREEKKPIKSMAVVSELCGLEKGQSEDMSAGNVFQAWKHWWPWRITMKSAWII